jgi:hypothetical protein
MKRIAVFLCLLYTLSLSVVYSPKLVVEGQTDFNSLQSIVKSITNDKMSDREKAEAVWRFVLASTFHYKSPEEGLPGNGIRFEMNTLEDPLKILTSYGHLYCFTNVSLMTKLWEAAGLDSTRVWGIGGHLISEVYYDGAWHHYDGDQSVSGYFIKKDGKTVASIAEIQDDPDYYIINPEFKSTPQMPYSDKFVYAHESREVLANYYRTKTDNYIRDRIGVTTHRMDYYLKKNEELTLFFEPQGKWRHNGMDVPVINPINGPFDAHSDRKYGNGLFVYKPNLEDSSIISEGFHYSENIKIDKGVVLKDAAKKGEFVVKTLSPWVITGKPIGASATSDGKERYIDAAVVSGRILNMKNVLTSTAPGLEILIRTEKSPKWESVYKTSSCGYFNVDLSEHFTLANYYYELKIVMDKDTLGTKITDLAFTTSVQVNPASLPKLKAGKNKIMYSMNGPEVDKVSLENGSVPGAPVDAYVVNMNNVNVTKETSRRFVQSDTSKPGIIILKQNSENGAMTDYWFEILFHQREKGITVLEYSENDTLNWKKFDKKPKLHHDHWADWHSSIIVPEKKNTKTVYYKVTINGSAALCLFNGGYRYPYKKSEGSISVDQVVDADGKEMRYTWGFDSKNGEKLITVKGKVIRNKFLRFICK